MEKNSPRFTVGPCGDPLRLWYVERITTTSLFPGTRRYFRSRLAAREAAKLLRQGKIDFQNDADFKRQGW